MIRSSDGELLVGGKSHGHFTIAKYTVDGHIDSAFGEKQRAFLDFVLGHYVREGVAELDEAKLTPLLRLKYHNSIADAVADLGSAADIRKSFKDFQKYLYQEAAAA